MRLILSRKGFDSSAGGVPSPLLPDGRLLSLPIPDKQSVVRYGDIRCQGISLGNVVRQLTGGRIRANHGAHLDPDLSHGSLPRAPGWRPIFGQKGQAQGHLRNQGVGPGDLFLFFGLFRAVELRRGVYHWARHARPLHAIWGWMQVETVLPVAAAQATGLAWAGYHPHFQDTTAPNNVVYLAPGRLQVDGRETGLPGAGIFTRLAPERQLSARQATSPSLWDLPAWLHPGDTRRPLTYHTDRRRWQRRGERAGLRTVARGQEFVIHCQDYPEAMPWACGLIERGAAAV